MFVIAAFKKVSEREITIRFCRRAREKADEISTYLRILIGGTKRKDKISPGWGTSPQKKVSPLYAR